MLYNILLEFFKENKKIVFYYISSCTLNYIVKVLLVSRVYSDFFKKDSSPNAIRNLILVWILRCIISYIKSYNESIILPEITFFIRKKLFTEYIEINSIFYNDADVSLDLRQIIDLSRLIRDIFVWFSETIIPVFILMICINSYFLYKFPKVGLINITGNITTLSIIFLNYKKILLSSIHKEDLYIKILKNIDDNFNNLMNVYLAGNEKKTLNEIISLERQHIKFYRQQCRELDTFSTSIRFTNYFFSVICLYNIYNNSGINEFINVLLIFTFYIQTFESFTDDIPMYTLILANIKHIEDFLNNKIFKKKNEIKTYSRNLDNYQGSISINNLTFKYDTKQNGYIDFIEDKKINEDNTNILNNLNLTIKPQERIVILAKSGSGKTTLMKLILAFYKANEGNILLDNIDINDIDPSDIRKKINYINQKTLLFNDSIINNMKYGNNKSTEEIIEFLKKYNLLNIFRNCDKSPNTCLNKVIEINGSNMSMGMQKIIFLIRGILKSNSYVYIFDEPLTSLDPSTRNDIINMINNETRGKTLIIITHDKEISKIVDKTYKLEELQN